MECTVEINRCSSLKIWIASFRPFIQLKNLHWKETARMKQCIMKYVNLNDRGHAARLLRTRSPRPSMRAGSPRSSILNLILFLFIASTIAAEENPALQNLLVNRLRSCNCSMVLVNPQNDHILASLNADPILKESHPPGSLMKIFTLIAYSQTHQTFPKFSCPPTLARDPQGCWDRNGHGQVDAQKAVAFSCNVYFRQLAEQTSPEVFERVLNQFGILNEQLNDQLLRKLMVGTTMDVKVSPQRLLYAYTAFFNNPNRFSVSPEVRSLIRNGMAEGAKHGTSTEASVQAGVPMLGKT